MTTPKRAAWTVAVRQRSVEPDGTAKIVAELLDAGQLQLTLTLTVSADRSVQLFVHGEPTARLSGFTAWSDL